MKNCLITISSGYSFEDLNNWIKTALANLDETTDIVLLIDKKDRDTFKYIHKNYERISLIPIETKEVFYKIHVTRFLELATFLKPKVNDYKYILFTDVRDVIFQSDPFVWISNNIQDKKIIVQTEGIKYKDYVLWGANDFIKTFGEEVFKIYENNDSYCCGVFAGESLSILNLFEDIYSNSITKPSPTGDQAVLNYLIHQTNYKDSVLFLPYDSSFTCHLGVFAAVPKNEHIEQTFTNKKPMNVDGKVYTANNELYSIVHQYDRISDWKVDSE